MQGVTGMNTGIRLTVSRSLVVCLVACLVTSSVQASFWSTLWSNPRKVLLGALSVGIAGVVLWKTYKKDPSSSSLPHQSSTNASQAGVLGSSTTITSKPVSTIDRLASVSSSNTSSPSSFLPSQSVGGVSQMGTRTRSTMATSLPVDTGSDIVSSSLSSIFSGPQLELPPDIQELLDKGVRLDRFAKNGSSKQQSDTSKVKKEDTEDAFNRPLPIKEDTLLLGIQVDNKHKEDVQGVKGTNKTDQSLTRVPQAVATKSQIDMKHRADVAQTDAVSSNRSQPIGKKTKSLPVICAIDPAYPKTISYARRVASDKTNPASGWWGNFLQYLEDNVNILPEDQRADFSRMLSQSK